tara:strand:- start:967 stop:1752 length:786 start_codon:yes stop_codon:yes gene_type:complete
MANLDEHFGPYEAEGFSIKRDRRTKEAILEIAGQWLGRKREGTELDDHLSDDIPCQRKVVLKKRGDEALRRLGGTPSSKLTAQEVIFFGFGHGFQDTILGPSAEEAMWSDEHQLWYSPDGKFLIGDNEYHEVKTTRRSALKKADREAGLTIEDVLYRDNAAWWKYIEGVMHLTGTTTYYLHVAWIIPAEMESFRIDITPERVERSWKEMTKRREERRSHLKRGTLPPVTSRRGAYECNNCPYVNAEPCMSEVVIQNAMESD